MKRTFFTLATLLLASLPILRADTLPDDVRLKPLKELNGYFPFTPPGSRASASPCW